MSNKWNLFGCLYWLFWAISFGVWETYAYFHNDRIPLLTQVVTRYVPWWLTTGLLLWGLWHFGVRYSNPAYLKWLRGN